MSGKTFNAGPVSAYGIAVENGFVGTEKEWLQSLKGGSLPEVGPGDAGKIAGVDSTGNWAAVNVDRAEEETF